MFQFPGSASRLRGIPCLQHGGLPHSDTCGSRPVCGSPQLFAAYHVLHSLREPRHPPYALLHFLLDSPMCSLLGILSYTSPLFFYYLLSTLSLQYVNELFAGASNALSAERLVPCEGNASGNAIIDQPRAHSFQLPAFLLPLPVSTFQFQNNLVRLPRALSLSAQVFPCGEYRIRTDDPLLAKQVL